jgi:hypothetical protein
MVNLRKQADVPNSTCCRPSCVRAVHYRALCRKHYDETRPGGLTCTFPDCTRTHYGLGWCRKHYGRARNNGGDPSVAQGSWRETWTRTDAKPCKDCEAVKPLADFSPQRLGFLGRVARCRPCQNVYQNAIKARPDQKAKRRALDSTPERIASMRMAWVRRTYGPAGVEIEERRRAGLPCDVCGRQTPGMSLDHCHTTKRARGLLCRDCNWALGKVRDDPEVLRALAEYVERFR